ncbi:MAG: hypothetical protein H6617_10300 [Bdellovibrionaceae bacterium]|nr:hypothetical protein [Bdellovibrionales bacterium]MCB9255060.1 hypothetical protein [Pseudobdellovibrionaceae bacterium]
MRTRARKPFLFVFVLIAFLGQTAFSIPLINLKPSLLDHYSGPAKTPQRQEADEQPKTDEPTAANEEFKKKLTELKDRYYTEEEGGKLKRKTPSGDGDEYDGIQLHSGDMEKALGVLDTLDGEKPLAEQIATQLTEVNSKIDLKKEETLSDHEKLLVGLGQLEATLQKALGEGSEDFKLSGIDDLLTAAQKDDDEGKEAKVALGQLVSTLRALEEKKGAEKFALDRVKDYIADRLVTQVDEAFKTGELPKLASTDPKFAEAQARWQQATSLNPGAFERNTEIGRLFQGRAASGKSTAYTDAAPKEDRSVKDDSGKRYKYRPVTLTTETGGTSEFEVFEDTASGQLFGVKKSDGGVAAYMNNGKGAKLGILYQISGNAALRQTGKTEDGRIVFEGYQEGDENSTREVAGVYYRTLPKQKDSGNAPAPGGNTAEVGKIYSRNDGTHKEFNEGLYVPAALTHGRDVDYNQPEKVQVGYHQRDAVLAQAANAHKILTAEGGIPKELKDQLPELRKVTIDGKTYLGRNHHETLTEVFLGLDNDNKPIFFCATCQPGVALPEKPAEDYEAITAAVKKEKPVQFAVDKKAKPYGTITSEGTQFSVRPTNDGKGQEIFHPQVGWVPAIKNGGSWQVAYDQGGDGKLSPEDKHTPLSYLARQHSSLPTSVEPVKEKDEIAKTVASATARLASLPTGAQRDSFSRISVSINGGARVPFPTATVGEKLYVMDYVQEGGQWKPMWIPKDQWSLSDKAADIIFKRGVPSFSGSTSVGSTHSGSTVSSGHPGSYPSYSSTPSYSSSSTSSSGSTVVRSSSSSLPYPAPPGTRWARS